MPRSLYGRATLILVFPVTMILLVLSITFIQRLYEDVTEQMTQNILLEVSYLIRLIDSAPDLAGAQQAVDPFRVPLAIDVQLPSDGPQADSRVVYDLSGRLVIATMRRAIPSIVGIDLTSNDNLVTFLVDTRHGPTRMQFARRRVSASNPHQLLVLMVGVSILMTVIAYLFLRNQLRPITRLAAAAEAFGKGQVVPYRPSGATEVRSAGAAFLDMRNRIERQIEQRTLMLSGVSHDLRTPLTRLRLGLSFLEPGEETREMERDVQDMEAMLDAFLDFVRGDALEDPEDVPLADFLEGVIDRASRGGAGVALAGPVADQVVSLRPMAVGRALDNLIGNAVRYGTRAELGIAVGDRTVRFTVEDDGPGIPAESRERAMRPFIRLDDARNQDRGTGVGLGLAIAADIARQHGGTLQLSDSARLGGLRADLVIAR